MAYRLRVYAPTGGVINLYITANGTSSIVYPAGESTPCYDNQNVTTAATINPSLAAGYTFSRWVITIDGATSYEYTQSISLPYNASWQNVFARIELAQSATYYAAINFDANGGTGAPGTVSGSTTSPDQYVQIQIPYGQPTRQNYTFAGWSMDPNAASPSYAPGGYITVYGTTATTYYTLYAVWVQSGGGVRVGNGYGFDSASAYIYSNGFQKYTPYIWDNGWKKAT